MRKHKEQKDGFKGNSYKTGYKNSQYIFYLLQGFNLVKKDKNQEMIIIAVT